MPRLQDSSILLASSVMVMWDLKPYAGPTKLLLAFDIGTTYSSVSYCILVPHQIPEVLAVTRQVLHRFLSI